MQKLPNGTWIDGGAIYVICDECGKTVRWNKPILGGMHLCLSDEEKAMKRRAEWMQKQHHATPCAAKSKL